MHTGEDYGISTAGNKITNVRHEQSGFCHPMVFDEPGGLPHFFFFIGRVHVDGQSSTNPNLVHPEGYTPPWDDQHDYNPNYVPTMYGVRDCMPHPDSADGWPFPGYYPNGECHNSKAQCTFGDFNKHTGKCDVLGIVRNGYVVGFNYVYGAWDTMETSLGIGAGFATSILVPSPLFNWGVTYQSTEILPPLECIPPPGGEFDDLVLFKASTETYHYLTPESKRIVFNTPGVWSNHLGDSSGFPTHSAGTISVLTSPQGGPNLDLHFGPAIGTTAQIPSFPLELPTQTCYCQCTDGVNVQVFENVGNCTDGTNCSNMCDNQCSSLDGGYYNGYSECYGDTTQRPVPPPSTTREPRPEPTGACNLDMWFYPEFRTITNADCDNTSYYDPPNCVSDGQLVGQWYHFRAGGNINLDSYRAEFMESCEEQCPDLGFIRGNPFHTWLSPMMPQSSNSETRNVMDLTITISTILERYQQIPTLQWYAPACSIWAMNTDGNTQLNVVDAITIINMILTLESDLTCCDFPETCQAEGFGCNPDTCQCEQANCCNTPDICTEEAWWYDIFEICNDDCECEQISCCEEGHTGCGEGKYCNQVFPAEDCTCESCSSDCWTDWIVWDDECGANGCGNSSNSYNGNYNCSNPGPASWNENYWEQEVCYKRLWTCGEEAKNLCGIPGNTSSTAEYKCAHPGESTNLPGDWCYPNCGTLTFEHPDFPLCNSEFLGFSFTGGCFSLNRCLACCYNAQYPCSTIESWMHNGYVHFTDEYGYNAQACDGCNDSGDGYNNCMMFNNYTCGSMYPNCP